MGYTHYWTFHKIKGQSKLTEQKYQKAIKVCQKLVRGYNSNIKKFDGEKSPLRLSGYTAHCKVGAYGGLKVNGTEKLSHEDFFMPEHFNDYFKQDLWGFCKTAQKPYDDVVTACLIILKHYLGDAITVSSDGQVSEWLKGLALARYHVADSNLTLPRTIESSTYRSRAQSIRLA